MAENTKTITDAAVAEAENNELHDWMRYGQERGWVSSSVCDTHDGTPVSEDELEEEETTGERPCVHILRLYPSAQIKADVEENFPEASPATAPSGLPGIWNRPILVSDLSI